MITKITDKQFIKTYRSAALWFVALYMEAFLLRISELEDDGRKSKLVEEIYDNGENAFDKDESGTRTRVNCLWRIIKAGRAVQALEVAANSNRLKKDFYDAFKIANDLLKRIKNGEFIMPKGYEA